MKYDQIYNNREDAFIYIKIRDFLAFIYNNLTYNKAYIDQPRRIYK